jgi:hypothetical protein
MSQKEAVLLVSRALALYLLCWAFSELSNIPVSLFSLAHHVSQRGVLAASDYFSDYDVLSLSLRVVRIVTLLGVAAWLYTCGLSTEKFFLRNKDAATVAPSSPGESSSTN